MEDERKRILQTIEALEAQRATLGEAVVQTALDTLRERLSALERGAVSEERRQATVLFADLSGFTRMAETMDAEEVRDALDSIWRRLDALIVKHGGHIDKHAGDSVMALWGVGGVREDDAERAVRAGLAMHQELDRIETRLPTRPRMRVGISTGPVSLGALGSKGEFTAMGDTVNLASRLEQAAPEGGILIARDTCRHLRGAFEVVPMQPLLVKGKAQPVKAYKVCAAAPRGGRHSPKGLDRSKAPLVGREAELKGLLEAFEEARETRSARLVTVVGEAGVGKSRLLEEFEERLDGLPGPPRRLRGHCAPDLEGTPYGLLRNLFSLTFGILDSDSAAEALAKFEAGVSPHLAPDQAHLAGHLVGFDFSATAAVKNLAGGPSFPLLAQAYLSASLRGLASDAPLVILLDDVHWADGPSLDFTSRLLREWEGGALLLVCVARPAFRERHPEWGAGAQGGLMELGPLSPGQSEALLDAVLGHEAAPPEALVDIVLGRSEGNPYFVEELTRMFLDEGSLQWEGSGWRLRGDALDESRVPPTLTGVLQARLDLLPPAHRDLLQRASVMGRVFWDEALTALQPRDSGESTKAGLAAAEAHRLVYPREPSAFAHALEYAFKHALLREVVYETVLIKRRRLLHSQAARWLEENAGDRISEYARAIAQHCERSGEVERAAEWRMRAGEAAMRGGALREAAADFGRALALLPSAREESLMAIRARLGTVQVRTGEHASGCAHLRAVLDEARRRADWEAAAEILAELGASSRLRGCLDESQALTREAEVLARRAGDPKAIALTLRQVGLTAHYRGEFEAADRCYREALAILGSEGDAQETALCLKDLGMVAVAQGRHGDGGEFYRRALTLFQAIGDRAGTASCLGNLGWLALFQKDTAAALAHTQESLSINREIGQRLGALVSLLNLGHIYADRGEVEKARKAYGESIVSARALESMPVLLEALAGLAGVQEREGHPIEAARLLGLALRHPASDSEVELAARETLSRLKAALPAETFEEAMEQGRRLDVEEVIEGIRLALSR